MPACGVSPEAMAKAMASGRATRPTVIPAMTSFKNLLTLYSRRQMTDLGSQRSSNFREMAGHIYTIMTRVSGERNNQRGTKGRGTQCDLCGAGALARGF